MFGDSREATRAAVRAILRSLPIPGRLEVTLARIQSTVGESRVGAPVLLDTHSPNAFQQNRFVLPGMKEKRSATEKQTTAAMRIFRPPLPATVEFQEGKPVFLGCEGTRRRILAFRRTVENER